MSDKSDWSDVSDLPADWYRVRIGTDGYGGGGNNPTGGGAVRAVLYIGGCCRLLLRVNSLIVAAAETAARVRICL